MDKNKIIEAAAKLVAKGAYDKAIKEYQKILDADPKDVRILQKMGELYQKKNDNSQAAHFFTKVAESYSTDGFFLKAVALYKQVLRLNPELIEVNLKLAELHQQLQLTSEAMGYYQSVASHYEKNGDTKASLDTLKKMVDLDPDNVASRIKLAELYAREEMNAEAGSEFKRAAEYLKRNNRADDYLRVAERISGLEPNNTQLARELADAYLARSDHKRALAKLQICFKADPRDIETLRLLGSAFQGLGQTSKTVSVYKELAKIYAEKGRTGEADNLWRQIETLDPNDPDLAARRAPSPAPARAAPAAPAPARGAPVSQAPAPSAPARPAPAPPARAAPAPTPSPAPSTTARDGLAKLLTETDVYVKYGLHDKAMEHLRKIFSVDPENLDAHEKAYQIYVSSNNPAQASEQLLNVLRLCTRQAAVERAQPYLATILQENPSHPEVPAFLAVLRSGGETQVEQPVEQLAEDAILVDSNDEEIIVADAPEDALANEDVALRTAAMGADEGDVVADDELVSEEAQTYELAEEAQEVGEDEPLVPTLNDLRSPRHAREPVEELEPVTSEGDVVVETEAEVELSSSELGETAYELGDDESATQLHAVPSAMLAESANVTQPMQKALRPSVEVEPALLVEDAEAEPVVVDEESTAGGAAAYQEEAVEPPPEEEPAAEECDEASFFLDQGLLEEAREILETIQIAYPGHQRASELLARLSALEAQGGAPAPGPLEEEAAPPSVLPMEGGGERDAFDLAAELASELGELGGEAEASAPTGGEDDFQYSVEEVFSEFKKGLQKVVKPEDVDTHYDLGIAYKEMGLVDDAIGEFEVARQGCVGKKKEVDCLTMVGLLQMMRGDAGAAVAAFRQALGTEHATGETEKALRFELGLSHEAAGSAGKALYQFQKVEQLDPSYREVKSHVTRLGASTQPEPDEEEHANGTNGVRGKPGGGQGGPTGAANKAAPPAAAGPKTRKVGYL
ncbi:MAG: tetratricopeptide repeat protein [Myxococcota bacterium]